MDSLLNETGLNTVCQEAMCPNITECFKNKNATFLILGNICTRGCSFCNVNKGIPSKVDINEPLNVAKAVKMLGLEYVVITSPTRDDLSDGGAQHYCNTVNAIKEVDDTIDVELLIPDLKQKQLSQIARLGASVIGHNIETVPRLYHIRKGAKYQRSLNVLKKLSELGAVTKSGIMLGLGEKDDEVLFVMEDILNTGCSFLSIGQYLSPSLKHESVVEFVKPEKFEFFKDAGMKMGFKAIKSSPYTRSSYMAHEYLRN